MGRPKLLGFADPAPSPRNGRPSPSGHAGSAEGCLAPSVEPVSQSRGRVVGPEALSQRALAASGAMNHQNYFVSYTPKKV
jgi:hypothetical protein